LSDDAQRQFREVQTYFRLPSVALVEKDLYVVRAIAALAAIDATPFALIFGGGTALARAHKLVRRMSEDVDFKIVPKPSAPVSRSAIRRQLGLIRARVSQALHEAGFAFDPDDAAASYAMDSNRYAVWHLPYTNDSGAGEGLRPTIKVELNYAPLRRKAVTLPVQSFVAEATGRPAEAPAVVCVSIVETAAEKLVSLTRRTAMELAGAGREPDPTLVRHIYDLHMMRDLVDPAEVATLARTIAEADAQEFDNQFPAYTADIAGETRKALDALRTDPMHRRRYEDFVNGMVYGKRVEFATAMQTVVDLSDIAWSER
jgi:hypothetical protein